LVGLVDLNVVNAVKRRKRFVPIFTSANSRCEFDEYGDAAQCVRCKAIGKPCGGRVLSQEARSVEGANNDRRSDNETCVQDAVNPSETQCVQRQFCALKKLPLTLSDGVPLQGRRDLTALDLGRMFTSIDVRTIMETAVNTLQAEFQSADIDTIALAVRDALLLCGLECNSREVSPAPTSSTIPRSPSPESPLYHLPFTLSHGDHFSHRYPYV